jgi:SAM-dependent methyltransferase
MEEIKDIDAFYQEQRVRYPSALGSKTLDLGCGTKPRNPFSAHTVFGVDINDVGISNIVQSDLSQSPIPFENGSMDYITAFDFIEHVPRVINLPSIRFSFIELMNEIHRVLKPGGIFLAQTPVYPFSACFTDPTHVNPVTSETFSLYFDDQRKWGAIYGFKGSFRVRQQVLFSTHLLTVLQKT